jgi:alkane 1-monooxygenase
MNIHISCFSDPLVNHGGAKRTRQIISLFKGSETRIIGIHQLRAKAFRCQLIHYPSALLFIVLFYFRTVIMGFLSACHIAGEDQQKKGKPIFHFSNQMIQFQLLQLALVVIIYFIFELKIMMAFMVAATIGFLLLETVNYIEHYGLERKLGSSGQYERAMPQHSWNSNHILGRLMLFELSRHSDHHYLASRKYQILRNHEEAPQMPTGYPGMMILSLFPPIWFRIMNRKIDRLNQAG